jgi:hypothetical protein
MTKTYKFEEHLKALLVEEKLCFKEGDWDRLNQIRLAIDDTQDQIAKAKASVNWKHDAPINPQFLGAQPARAGEDY